MAFLLATFVQFYKKGDIDLWTAFDYYIIGEEKHTIYLCVWFSWIAGLLALLDENEHDLKVSFLISFL